jgi:hypothetical protein
MRRDALDVIFRTERATSGVGMNSPLPMNMFRSE